MNYEKGAEILKRSKALEGYSLRIQMLREECEAIREADGFEEGYAKGEAAGFKKSEARVNYQVHLK